ncbi:MAG TPA: hypothetical protein VGO98_01855, partial [Candidatus Saccharimonadales bacterium]|nr:hypothetical protein [Candidatus Saccharimonadales bacterium]
TPNINQQTIIVWDEINQRENKVDQPPQEVQAWSVAVILATKKRLERRGVDLNTYDTSVRVSS